mgnify:FL=1
MEKQPNNSEIPEDQASILTSIIRAFLLGISAILLIPLLPFQIRIVTEYERGVIFRLGRLQGAKGPGLFVMLPFIDRMVKVDLRTITLDVPTQEAITSDNVTIKVNAVIFFRVLNPEYAVVKVLDFIRATSQISQTTLRSVMGQIELEDLLGKRDEVNQQLQNIIDEETEPWGIKVSTVEVKDLELPPTMQRAMAAQAEEERSRRAKIIAADGEFQASERLAEAANVMAKEPISLQLRYLQTLGEIAGDRSNTIVFPLPMDLVSKFFDNESSENN